MRRRFTNQNINQLGYTDNTNTAYNNYNVIPSNNITMQNTSAPIMGQGLDQYGNPISQPVVMQPGQNYQFPNATYVEETPQFQNGGAYNVPTSYPPTPTFGNNFNQPQLNQWNSAYLSGQGQPPQLSNVQPNTNVQTSNGINQWNEAYLTGQGQPYQEQPTEVQQGLIDANYPEQVTPETSTNPQLGRFQFYNPYGGYSVENASFQLGQGIESGNTLQTVGAGLKMLTGLGRNVLSGLGYQRQNDQVMEEYRRKQREALTQENRPQYMQDGGAVQGQEEQLVQGIVQALQEGAQPEEVLQALMQQGIDEQTAMQLIQAVMQQLQGQQTQQEGQPMMRNGGEYLSKMKGKKIKNYTYNSKTGNYDVEFE